MDDIFKTAEIAQKKAWEVIRETNVMEIWREAGNEINLVGSLKMGLLMKHRDIDFHIYSDPVSLQSDFAAMAKLAGNPSVKHIEYTNLLDTDEKCTEWHALYTDREGMTWQLDMIHILKGSFYDGYFEKMAERIMETLTPETRTAILTIKNDTPETEKIMGIEYYQAVIRDGIRNYADFSAWRKEHPVTGVIHWIP